MKKHRHTQHQFMWILLSVVIILSISVWLLSSLKNGQVSDAKATLGNTVPAGTSVKSMMETLNGMDLTEDGSDFGELEN